MQKTSVWSFEYFELLISKSVYAKPVRQDHHNLELLHVILWHPNTDKPLRRIMHLSTQLIIRLKDYCFLINYKLSQERERDFRFINLYCKQAETGNQ